MATASDEELTRRVAELFREAAFPIDVEVHAGVARLTGLVTSPEIHQAAIDLARFVEGIVDVDDQLDYEVISPDTAFEAPDVDREYGFADEWALKDDLSDTEPDFVGQVDADEYQRAVEEGEPYFPPTDRVLRPSTSPEELQVVGGFQDTSMDEVATTEDEGPGQQPGETDLYRHRDDEDIRDDVLRELSEDSLTTDLTLRVNVVNGVVFLHGAVPSIDDAENAEAVAGGVPGVVEVRDLTEVEA